MIEKMLINGREESGRELVGFNVHKGGANLLEWGRAAESIEMTIIPLTHYPAFLIILMNLL